MNIRKDLILKYNQAGPRYTSYPPANYFHEGITENDFIKAIIRSNHEQPHNISLYVHIPFCPRLCHFCGCTTFGSKDINLIRSYIDALKIEIGQVAHLLDCSRSVTQIHWGGGTPNSIPLNMVQEVMDLFRELFKIDPHAEIAMECSPAYLEFEDIDRLSTMGFNRLSLGIQDFNDDVLKNVNREPSKHPVEELARRMIENGFKGLNLDLIYGLPGQTPENFKRSIEKAIEVNPSRLATFSYAHVPWVKKAQSVLEEIGISSAAEKLALMEIAYSLLTENGYMSIGMDHYAKPDDDLYQAFLDKQLHRNFQGYCTRATTGQVYGFGCSSISQLESGYYQNNKTIKGYLESIINTGWAVERGYQLNDDEKIIRTVINEVMCNLFVDFNEVGNLYGKTAAQVKEIIGYDEDKLAPFLADDLLVINGENIKIETDGSLVVRNIAMAFDPQLSVMQNQYSKTI